MPKKKQEKFAEPWKNIAAVWKSLKHPARPCKKNIRDYKKFIDEVIAKKKFARVLVFGATPELRDILAQYHNIEITIVDFNIEMILGMTELMKYKEKTSREIWLKSDWLKAPLKENHYDVLLGDALFQNLPRLKHPFFVEKCYKLLKRGGYFITRLCAKYPGAKVYKFKDLLKDYIKGNPNFENFDDFWTIALFCSNIGKNHRTGINLLLKETKKYIQDPKVKKLYKKIRMTFPKNKEWTYSNWEKDKGVIEKYFVLKDSAEEPKRAKDYHWARILKLKKKSVVVK